jgi:hypothetical protein
LESARKERGRERLVSAGCPSPPSSTSPIDASGRCQEEEEEEEERVAEAEEVEGGEEVRWAAPEEGGA